MKPIKVLLFATLREIAGGKKSIEVDLPEEATVGDLKVEVARLYPQLTVSMQTVLVAVNREFAFDETVLREGVEVALFPPVSGGAVGERPEVFAITEDEIDINAMLAQITLPSTGAAAVFSGMVRGRTRRDDPHETIYLEYEAYRPMAEAMMRQIAGEMRQTWPSLEGIAIVQRIGRLYPGTPTVLIACTAAHRDTGVFEAARYGIDRLKEIVPIWKREVGPKGAVWVEGKYIPKPPR
jgi:molybdopterin converting factor subunit 1